MHMHSQRGVSLLGTAVVMAIIAIVAMGALMSMRQERNLFADAWARLAGTPAVQSIGQAQDASKPQPASIRKCTVDGKVVYSNVDCGAQNPTAEPVELHDSRGIEAPKAVIPADGGQAQAPDMRNRMIERAISQ